METIVPAKSDTVDVGVIMATLGTAFSQAAGHQADAARIASEASVEVARIEADKQLKLAGMQHESHRMSLTSNTKLLWGGLVTISALVIASLAFGHVQIATHIITAVGGVAAGYFAGKAKR